MENGFNIVFETNATNLTRLMNCNGSASMAVFKTAMEDANAIIRDEGTAAHHLAVHLNYDTEGEKLIGSEAPNGVFMTEEMLLIVNEYVNYINDRSPDRFFSEMEVDTSHQNDDYYRVNGRADNITHTQDNVLFVDDFKYGYRIVEPDMNWTLISHAIGYCASRPDQPLPDEFVFSIIQPQPTHRDGKFRQWVVNQQEFTALWRKLSSTLSNLTDVLRTGNHCRRCPSLVYCSAATKAGYNSVDVSDIAFEETMTNSELSHTMDLLYSAISRAEHKLDALEELALHKMKSGEVVENYMPENSLGHTTWLKFVKPELIDKLTGVDVRSGKMVTPNKAIELGVPKDIVEMVTHRPNRGVKLKRVSANTKAQKMFLNMKGEQ